jgi:hypothetical protein
VKHLSNDELREEVDAILRGDIEAAKEIAARNGRFGGPGRYENETERDECRRSTTDS